MLDTSLIYREFFAIDTSSISLDLSSFCSRYLLDLSRCVFLYISEVQPNFAQTQISQSLSLLFWTKPFLFTKNLFHSRFQPNPSLILLVRVLNTIFFSFFMHFMHFRPRFSLFGKFFGFLSFLWNFWVGFCWFVLTCSCIALSSIIIMLSCILGCVLDLTMLVQ